MEIRNEDLPVTLQAFDLLDQKEIFIAEQVVNSQADIDMFTARYTGKLIKAKKATTSDVNTTNYGRTAIQKKRSSGNAVMVVILLILVALIIYGFSTGWIQEKLNLKI